jgi:hypothetical protein
MHGKPEVDVFIFATKYISISFQLHSLYLREGEGIENRPGQNFNCPPPQVLTARCLEVEAI